MQQHNAPIRDAIEGLIPGPIEKILFALKGRVLMAVDFFRKAPAVEGIPASEQVQNYRELMKLKIRGMRGEDMPFSDRKRLRLSDAFDFRNNSSLLSTGRFEIDPEVRALSKAINSTEFLYTLGSCAGHLVEEDDEVFFNDTGFVSFAVDSDHDKASQFLTDLEEFCRQQTADYPDCTYALEPLDEWYAVSWNWNEPSYEEARRLQNAFLENEDASLVEHEKALDALFEKRKAASLIARDKDIHGKHIAFVQKLEDFISQY